MRPWHEHEALLRDGVDRYPFDHSGNVEFLLGHIKKERNRRAALKRDVRAWRAVALVMLVLSIAAVAL